LPIRNPPSEVSVVTVVQSPFFGGATGLIGWDSAEPPLPLAFSAFQAAVAKLAAASARKRVRVFTWAGSG
jgi:hypothetical protein